MVSEEHDVIEGYSERLASDRLQLARSSQLTSLEVLQNQEAYRKLLSHYNKSTCLKLKGPINFMSVFAVDDLIDQIQESAFSGKSIVLDAGGVTMLEFTGVEELVVRLKDLVSEGIEIEFVNCSSAMLAALNQCDPTRQIARYAKLSEVEKDAE